MFLFSSSCPPSFIVFDFHMVCLNPPYFVCSLNHLLPHHQGVTTTYTLVADRHKRPPSLHEFCFVPSTICHLQTPLDCIFFTAFHSIVKMKSDIAGIVPLQTRRVCPHAVVPGFVPHGGTSRTKASLHAGVTLLHLSGLAPRLGVVHLQLI
jgi:hypothetical protein